MMPLNYAILKYFTTIKEACASDVITALAPQYESFKAFNKKSVENSLMTAETNGILQETRFEKNKNNDLDVYYCASQEGVNMINRYLKN